MKKPTKKQLKSIEEIMENFDFERTLGIMYFLRWEWWDTGVPSLEQIKKRAREILFSTCGKWSYHGSGGFIAERRGNNFSLKFCTDEWTTESE